MVVIGWLGSKVADLVSLRQLSSCYEQHLFLQAKPVDFRLHRAVKMVMQLGRAAGAVFAEKPAPADLTTDHHTLSCVAAHHT